MIRRGFRGTVVAAMPGGLLNEAGVRVPYVIGPMVDDPDYEGYLAKWSAAPNSPFVCVIEVPNSGGSRVYRIPCEFVFAPAYCPCCGTPVNIDDAKWTVPARFDPAIPVNPAAQLAHTVPEGDSR